MRVPTETGEVVRGTDLPPARELSGHQKVTRGSPSSQMADGLDVNKSFERG